MAAAAKRYGIDVDSLGPKFQGERIAASAQDIVDTFDMLTENGASVGGVLFGMREEINALVKDALKFGTALPGQHEAVDRGAAARRATSSTRTATRSPTSPSCSSVTPVESKLDKVNTEIEQVTQQIEELTAKIGEDLVAAFEKLPTQITLDVDSAHYRSGDPRRARSPWCR